jgi:hypothetical protein
MWKEEVAKVCKISDFRCCVVEAFNLLGCCVAQFGSWLPTFCGPETPATNYQPMPHNIPEEPRPQLQCDGTIKDP